MRLSLMATMRLPLLANVAQITDEAICALRAQLGGKIGDVGGGFNDLGGRLGRGERESLG